MEEGFLSQMERRLEGGPCVMLQAVGPLCESDFSAQLVMWRLAIQANAVDSSLKCYNIEVMFFLAFEFFWTCAVFNTYLAQFGSVWHQSVGITRSGCPADADTDVVTFLPLAIK